MTAFVTRYSSNSAIGRVHAVQIWNEQNLNIEWGKRPSTSSRRGLRRAAADGVRVRQSRGSIGHRHHRAAWPRPAPTTTMPVRTTSTCAGCTRPGAKPYFDASPRPRLQGAADGQPGRGGQQRDLGRQPLLRVPPGRGHAADHGGVRRLGQADLAAGVRLDQRHRQPGVRLAPVSEEEKGDNLVGAYRWAAENWAPWIGVMCLWTMLIPPGGRRMRSTGGRS